MNSYIFSFSNSIDLEANIDLITLDSACGENIFNVVLSNERELFRLFDLLEIDSVIEKTVSNSQDFDKLFDYSDNKLKDLSGTQFDQFYKEWLIETGRDNNMDEYGQLVFLHSQASKWNKYAFKFVLREKS